MSSLSLAKRILGKGAEVAEEAALKLASKAREVSPDNTNKAYEILKSRKNVRLAEEAAKDAADVRAANLAEEQVPRSRAAEPNAAERELKHSLEKSDKEQALIERWTKSQEAEKANRANRAKVLSGDDAPKAMVLSGEEATKVMDEATVALPDSTKVSAVVAAPAIGMQVGNPLDTLKKGYDKFEQVRASVVNKIVDLTGAPLLDNPHVPQYAKDTYKKAAESVVGTATNPLTYAGGAGAADAAIGVASAGYDMSQQKRKPASQPQVSYPGDKKVQEIKYRP